MSFLDIFSSKPEAAPAPVATPAPGAIPDTAAAAQPTGPQGIVPPETAAPVVAVPTEPASPLAQYKELWDTVPTDPNAPPAEPAALDPAKLAEVVNKADFSNTINPETLAAVTAGGEGAAAALQQVMNSVAQQVMLQSTLASNKMIEQQVQAAITKTKQSLPELVRQQNTSNSLRDSNPVFSDPAVKPVIEAVQAQLASKNPNATATELTTMAQNFVTVMGEAFSPAPATPPAQAGEVDWNKFIQPPSPQ